ncbi:transcription factor CP2-like [Halichondria panicea]|uniref:transcription factor CP2-like n=1 Tax=Halichondria panicea TaxID=6063 RepID=UPI00312B9583
MAQGSGSSSNRWKLEDLQDLEQYGLAAELESTNLGGTPTQEDEAIFINDAAFSSYDMSGVLSELLTEGGGMFSDTLLTIPLMATETSPPQIIRAVLKAPTAHGVKNTQEEVTFIQKGHSYELHVSHNGGDQMTEIMFRSVLLLTFSELRLKNCEEEQFVQWINDHPVERLLEMDNVGCGGVGFIENSETNLQTISFTWSSLTPAIVAFKVNCLSSEFAPRKHGGERGIPLRLQLDTSSAEGSTGNMTSGDKGRERLVERLVCNIKVFKDKGAERKQRQEQLKMEKLSPLEQSNYHISQIVTTLHPIQVPVDATTMMHKQTIVAPAPLPVPPEHASPFHVTTSPRLPPLQSSAPEMDVSPTLDHAHTWLTTNRFGQFLSLFANYTCQDLLRLSRRDLLDLCGPADGIRLYNALRSHTVKVIYITTGTDKICEVLCLEQLTARELGVKVADKLGISPPSISSLVRLTSTGVLVLVDDTVIHNIHDEEVFLLRAIKQEDGMYQVVLQDHTPCDQSQLSIRGGEFRH